MQRRPVPPQLYMWLTVATSDHIYRGPSGRTSRTGLGTQGDALG
jgi:hypothetical protein